MESTPQQTLIPLEQGIIPFHGSQFLAGRLPDNRVAATINSLCDMLGIRPHGQVRGIRRDKDLAEHLLFAQMETTGGLQRMAVLVAEAIPFWVVRLRFDQIAAEKREFILFLKMEAVEALYGYFYKATVGQAAPPPPNPSPAPRSIWQEGRLFIDHLEAEFEDMRQRSYPGQQEL